MEFTDLCLGSKQWVDGESSQSEITRNREVHQNSDDLQLQSPLPSDWEQFLDLQSGRMYYVNRKTSMKIWDNSRPESDHQEIELELNMISTGSGNNNNMVALACSNCHLLVILSKSSPSCPNCKYVHSLPYILTKIYINP